MLILSGFDSIYSIYVTKHYSKQVIVFKEKKYVNVIPVMPDNNNW